MTPTRRRPYRSIPLLLLALTASASAQAAESYLKVIPGTALAWGAVNRMGEASDKIQKLAGIVQAPAVSVLDLVKKEKGVTKGLDEKGAAGVFGLPGKTEKDASVGAFFFAVADEKAFLGNFEVVKAGEKLSEIKLKTADATIYCLAMRGGYALIAPKSDRAAIEAALEAKQDVSAEMAGLESWIAENDATVAGTAAGIKYAAREAREGLKKSKEGMAGAAEMAGLHSFLDVLDKAMEAAPHELSLALAGIRCDKQGTVCVIGRARLASGGLVSAAVATIPPVKESLLSGLPGGPFVVAAGGVGMPKLIDAYMDMAAGFMTSMKSLYGMSAQDVQRMSKESLERFRQVRSINFLMKSGKRSDPIYSNMFSVLGVDNSRQFLESLEKYAGGANKLLEKAKHGMLKSIDAKRLEIAGKPAVRLEMKLDLSSLSGPEGGQAVLEDMMGFGGKIVMHYVAADEHTVVMGLGVSEDRLVAAMAVLKQPKKSLAQDAVVSVTAALLPAGSQWVAYISPRGYMQLTQRFMAAALKNNPIAANFSLPPFPKCPPLGIAVKAEPVELRAEIVVPSELLKAAGEYVQDIQKTFMNRLLEQNQPPAP